MSSVIFNIPARLVDAYRGQKLIVRANDPSEFVRNILPSDMGSVEYVQLLDLEAPTDSLTSWGEGVPVDLVTSMPAEQFTLLYNFSALQHKHPVRATIAVRPGFSKAVKAALALRFAVKLDVSQPDPTLIDELAEVRELFLRRSTVDQPVEFFHSVFFSFYLHEPVSLWHIQEEDPDKFCYVTDEGDEVPSRRIASAVEYDAANERRSTSECSECEFVDLCRGYFKLPRATYDCAGVKTLFASLKTAAGELEGDLKFYTVSKGVKQ